VEEISCDGLQKKGKSMNFHDGAALRRVLAASVCAAFAIESDVGAAQLQANIPQHWVPGDGSAVAGLFRAMDAKHKTTNRLVASALVVTSCADDGGAGTLRSVVSGAGDGDVVDMSGLSCGPITLTNGAIQSYADSLTIEGSGAADTVISGNNADRVFVHYGYTALALRNLTVRDGFNEVAGYKVAGGACILSNAVVTLDHAVVSNCKAIGEGAYGGGILAPGLTMYTSTLSGNTAQGSFLSTLTASYGAGAFAYRGTAALYDSTVSGNRAVPDSSNHYGSYDTGAGIFTDDGGYVLRSTINDNYTDGTGGGIATHGALIVSNSTISGNTATKKSGGGIFARDLDLSVVSSTITQNAAARGGGIYGGGLPGFGFGIILQSSIVANNFVSSGFADIAARSARAVSGSNNLVLNGQDDLLPADTLRTDPQLLPLGFNGGPTQTHAISPASPARDKGDNTAGLATDQRGIPFVRVYGTAADIGAFEYSLPDAIFKDNFEVP
jgi:predicted outer membrane repeat protein